MLASEDALVSVVIPTHNRRDRLVKAIASVKAQTRPCFEVIVVDDASNDGTQDYLRQMAAQDASLRVIRNEVAQGGARARNQGIAVAAGRWIAFLDDDDTWLPAKIERQLALLRANEAASAVSCWYYYKAPYRRQRIMHVSPNFTEQQMLSGNSLGGASVCFTSARVLKEIGGFDPYLRSGQDWELWLRLFYAGPILVCDEPLAVYQSHRGKRITRNVSSLYTGRRRTYFRYRRRMEPATRGVHLAALMYCRISADHAAFWRRVRVFKRIYALVGTAEALKYARWYLWCRAVGANSTDPSRLIALETEGPG
jgi:glycosyltransferase involved in cell wall biosynthesis